MSDIFTQTLQVSPVLALLGYILYQLWISQNKSGSKRDKAYDDIVKGQIKNYEELVDKVQDQNAKRELVSIERENKLQDVISKNQNIISKNQEIIKNLTSNLDIVNTVKLTVDKLSIDMEKVKDKLDDIEDK